MKNANELFEKYFITKSNHIIYTSK